MSIILDHVTIRYGNHEVIKDISTVFPDGKISTILGPNGCGKTTLLRAISRNLKLYSGSIQINNKHIQDYKVKELSKMLSYLPQFHHTPTSITVEELIGYGRNPYVNFLSRLTVKDHEIIQWAMEKTNLLEYKDRLVSNLSGGERQRVWIAMALAQNTKYILLDEPINNLDLCYQVEILDLIRTLNKEMFVTVVMVLHDVNYAIHYSDKVIVLKSGKIYNEGSPLNTIDEKLLSEVFHIKGHIEKSHGNMYLVPRYGCSN